MKTPIVVRTALAFVLLVTAAACRREPPKPRESLRQFPLKGVIQKVDRSRAEITVAHEAIPGFMDAMTMTYPVRDDPQVIAILAPGDRIEATLSLQGDRYWLERVLTKGFVPTPPGGPPPAAASNVVTPVPNRAISVGDPVPDFALTDQTGATVKLSQMRGEPVAVTFLYTRCPVADACPMTTAKFSRLAAMLKEKDFGRLLAVTVDPEHDTPRVLADYAKRAGADPKRWKFLTGPPREVAEVASKFGILYYPDHGQIVHGQGVAVVDPQGRLASIYYGQTWEPEHILRDLEAARKTG